MKIVKQSHEILTPITGEELKLIELAGRVCYKSEDRITDTSAEKFVRMLIKRGHESVLEHSMLTVRFITDRGISHQLVRHRMASPSQESTKINYGIDKFNNEITVIEPTIFIRNDPDLMLIWTVANKRAEECYFHLLSEGCKPVEARDVLPTDLKTEVVITANYREWRHILKLRCDYHAHPKMQGLMRNLLKDLQSRILVVFDDIYEEVCEGL